MQVPSQVQLTGDGLITDAGAARQRIEAMMRGGVNTATYIYETVPDSPDVPVRRFEIKQSMKEAPLTYDPQTGQKVRRVISGGLGIMTGARSSVNSAKTTCGTGRCGCC